MAVRTDAAAEGLVRTTGLVNYNSPYTLMGWVYVISEGATAIPVFGVINTLGSVQDGLYSYGINNAWVVNSGTVEGSSATVAAVGWQHVAMVRSSTTALTIYVNAANPATATDDVTARAAASFMSVGAWNTDTTYWASARYGAIKCWTAALTAAEIASEMRSIKPMRLADLWAYWPVLAGATERIRDYSGNGRDWANNGTVTDEDGPPVGWGVRPARRLWVGSGQTYRRFANDTLGSTEGRQAFFPTVLSRQVRSTLVVGEAGQGRAFTAGTAGTVTYAPTADGSVVSGTYSGTAGTRYTLIDDYGGGAQTSDYLDLTSNGGGTILFTFGTPAVPVGATGITVSMDYLDSDVGTGTGTNNVAGQLSYGGTTYGFSRHNPNTFGTTFTDWTDAWGTSPATNAAWTVAEANSIDSFGFGGIDWNPDVRIASTRLRITYTAAATATSHSILTQLLRFATETAGVAESLVRNLTSTANALRERVNEALGLAEGTLRRFALGRTASDTLGLTEGSQTSRTLGRILSEALGLIEGTGRGIAFVRTLAESLGLTEATARLRALRNEVSDALGLTEATTRFGGFVRTVADSLGLTEGISRTRALGRLVADSLGLTESADWTRALRRAVPEALGLTEELVRSLAQTLRRIIPESLGLTEGTATSRGFLREIAETLGLTEATSRARALGRLVAETLGLTEASLRARTLARITADSLGLSDAAARATGLFRAAADSLGLTESTLGNTASALVRWVSDTLGLAEGTLRRGGLFRPIADSLGLSEGIGVARTLRRLVGEALGLAESAFGARWLTRAIAEALGLADASLRGIGRVQVLADTLGITETVSRTRAMLRAVGEGLGLAEGAQSARGMLRSVAETLGLSEANLRARGLVRAVADSLGLAEVVSTVVAVSHDLYRVVSEVLGLTETAVWARFPVGALALRVSGEVRRLAVEGVERALRVARERRRLRGGP